VANGDHITVRELLNQTSGLTDYCNVPPATLCTPSPAEMGRRWTERELVEIGAEAAPTFPPGQGWAYTNTGYVLLGMIIERVTGHPLAAEYERRIFRPLGLRRTQFPVTTSMTRAYSSGYDVLAAGSWPLDVTATSPTIPLGRGSDRVNGGRPGHLHASAHEGTFGPAVPAR
jgi:D-alanyl-D-alanine carboxypeptidase